MFITHQLNAFDSVEDTALADMIAYDSPELYTKYFYRDFLVSQAYPSTARILRFTLDISSQRVMYNYLIPHETVATDFVQVNHAYDGLAYQWAYAVEHPFSAGNSIAKINVGEPSGNRNLKFRSDPQLVLHEPWFVSRPDGRKEDDGVLLIRALDVEENKGFS
uniref:Peptidase_M1 domain-containing protein n=1 Tax=Ascaris lumbricoides TaxID=6252 RepID=A0A0M3HFD0_ASCLU